jgi:hypothetical protein
VSPAVNSRFPPFRSKGASAIGMPTRFGTFSR